MENPHSQLCAVNRLRYLQERENKVLLKKFVFAHTFSRLKLFIIAMSQIPVFRFHLRGKTRGTSVKLRVKDVRAQGVNRETKQPALR